MSLLDAARYRLGMLRRALLDRAALRRELDEEIAFHLETEAMHRRHAGEPPDTAARGARRRFGRPERVRERVVDATGASALDALAQDLRFAARTFRRAPAFALVAALTLALGIGATTAVFGVADVALLRPLPYARPAALVALVDGQDDPQAPLDYRELLTWRGAGDVFADVAGYFTTTVTLTGGGEPEVLAGARVSASLARTLGVAPLVGRAFRDEEDAPDAERVVLLGEGLWRRRFGADPAVVGRALTLNGRPWVVVGVLPGGAHAVLPTDAAAGVRRDFWLPLRVDEKGAPPGLHFLSAVGRLRPGVDLARARGRVDALARGLRREDSSRHGLALVPLADRVVGDGRHVLVLLLAAVAAVLLVCCTNVASLLLARGATRTREVAVRGALGAGRGRVARQLLTESLVLALAGGVLGVAVAYGGLAALRAGAAATLPRASEAAVDGRVLAFALAVSAATGVLFGLVPALRLSRAGGPAELLRGAGRGTVGGPRDRVRPALVVAEVALSFLLLVGAGLLLRSFGRLLAVDKGFDAAHALTFSVSLPNARYPQAPQQYAFFRRALDAVRAVPGVRGAALASNLPLDGGANGGVTIPGKSFPPGAGPVADKRIVGADYFRVLGIPVVSGRAFADADGPDAPKVAVVNAAFARRYFPGENPLGKRVDFGWETVGTQEIVGVVGDLREHGLAEPAPPVIYVPFGQRTGETFAFFVVRAEGAGDPLRLTGAMRAAVYAVDRDQPIDQVRTLDAVVASGLADRRLALSLLGGFSALTLVLAAVGLYAVVSHAVSQRVQEIGVRMALGAETGTVLRLVLRQGGALVGAGVAVGAAAALGGARLLAGMLFGVGPADPATFVAVAAVLGGVALAASAVPAVRASRVDPVRALRDG